MNWIILIAIGVSIAVLVYFFNKNRTSEGGLSVSKKEAEKKAEALAAKRLIEANEKASLIKSSAQRISKNDKDKVARKKVFLEEKEKSLLAREKNIELQESQIKQKKTSLENDKQEIEALQEKTKKKLAEISGASEGEVKEQVKAEFEKELTDFIAKKSKSITEFIENNSDEIATDYFEAIIPNATVEYSAESTSAQINAESSRNVKAIIGNDRINAKKIEELTNVEIIEEEDNFITVSCLDPIRREVASRVVIKLIGRDKITPNLISDLVKIEKKALLLDVKNAGEEAARGAGFPKLPDELKLLLGKCKYRYSYGQNLLKHSIEMANLGEALAVYLGGDVKKSKLACLVHDIGKVAPHEGDQHHHISAELFAKYYDDDIVYNAIIAHHYDIDAKYLESEIVRLADSISGARPGARRNSIEEYIQKIKDIEEIANEPEGVKQAYAIRAGREVRVLVDPHRITDSEADGIAKYIAETIEEKLSYPGVIKVSVIRETVESETVKKE